VSEIDVERILAAVSRRLDAGPINLLPAAAASPISFMGGSGWGDEPPPPYIVDEGVATIPIAGIILQEAFDLCGFELATGYDRITANVAAAARDEDVSAIVLTIDSPGGAAIGNMEAAEELRRLADESGKPLIAFATSACSAAYALASAADEILVIPSGQLGCIGTICSRLDISGAMSTKGVREIVAAWPPGKAVQSSTGASSSEVHAHMMSQIKPIAELFIGHVASRRGVTREHVFGLNAITLIGAEAVAAGLGNEVVSKRGAYAAARRRMKPRRSYSMGSESAANDAAKAMLASLIAAVGLDPATTPNLEQVQSAAARTRELAALGDEVLQMTGLTKVIESSALVRTWKSSATEVLPATRAALAVREVQLAVGTGRLPPGEAYAADQEANAREYPSIPKLSERLVAMSLESVRAELAARAPMPATMRPPTPARRARPGSVSDQEAAKAGFKSAAEYQAWLDQHGPRRDAGEE
jgi:ClpP class serine protease